MRAINSPECDADVVYDLCVSGVGNQELRDRLKNVKGDVSAASSDYTQKSGTAAWFQIPPAPMKNDEIALGLVTKRELKNVYTTYMARAGKPARRIYGELLSKAPHDRCPYCGIGAVSTLDHYLPKSKFPKLSVLPINLVPSCKDCNTGKLAEFASLAENQALHPYFDHNLILTDQWLFAQVVECAPASVVFFVAPPDVWDDTSKNRVAAHFEGYDLATRYGVQASNELANLRHALMSLAQEAGKEIIQQHLSARLTGAAVNHKNDWQTAMFQALAGSEWYCSGGYA